MNSLFNYEGHDITQAQASVEPSNMPYNCQTPIYTNAMPNGYQNTVDNSLNVATINAVQQIANQSNQFVMKSAQENLMLRMTIEKLKKERQEKPDTYSFNNAGYGICVNSKGIEIIVGKIKIKKISEYRICKYNGFEDIICVTYTDSKDKEQTTTVSASNLSEKKLAGQFPGFEYICKNVKTANDFLAWYITSAFECTYPHLIPNYAGFSVYKENGTEKAVFCCNDSSINPALLQCCSDNIREKILISDKKTIEELNIYAKKYLNTSEKVTLYIFSLCGLFATLFSDISYPITQKLVISSPDTDTTRQICYYLKIFSRGQLPISFDTNKAKIRKIFLNSKDETIIINDCSITDNEKRRTDMLQYVLSLDSDSESQPHNTAIISNTAQYLVPENQKICLNIGNDFYVEMTQAEEKEMCYALNCITRYFIDIVCENYGKIKSSFLKAITILLEKENCQQLPYMQSKTSFAVMASMTIFISKHLNLPVYTDSISTVTLKSLSLSPEITGDSDDAITNDFAYQLNSCIKSGRINIVLHNKEMNFVKNEPQVIVKDELLMIEEKTIEDVLLPEMNTTESVHRIIKALEGVGLLHSTKKNRYPLTVYNHKEHLRITFIAMELEGILDSTTILKIKEGKYAEWFSVNSPNQNLIPVVTNRFGEKAYQRFEFEKADNMHCFFTGQSGSGKTHALTERACSLCKAKQKVIILDTSDSFLKDEMIDKLSAGGDIYTRKKVEIYINENVTFHKVEELGVPVDILKLEYPGLIETKRKIIDSILSAHIPNMGKVQKAALRNGITDLIEEGNLNMVDIYDRLTDSRVSDSLAMQFEDMLSCFLEYNLSEKSWDEFLNESKDIIVISTDATSGSGGSALVDMLLMSLFYYQRNNSKKHLAVFIDEIQNQNFSPEGAITQVLKEGRKYHISLNYATQFLPSGNKDILKVMNLASLKVFLQPDDISARAISKTTGVSASELCSMNQGECYISGNLYNNNAGCPRNGIIHGFTYRNFVPFKMKI